MDFKRKKIPSYHFFTGAAFIFVFIIAILAILSAALGNTAENIQSIKDGWVNEYQDEVNLTNINGITKITRYVDSLGTTTSIIFRARNCYTDIYVNGELVQEDMKLDSHLIGSSPGSRWHIITLPESDSPICITLNVTSCYENTHSTIDNIYLGNIQDVYYQVTSDNLAGFIICIILQFISLLIIIMYVFLRRRFDVGNDLLYLGITSFFSAQWAAIESLIWQLYLGHSELFHILSYLSLITIPLGFGLFAGSRLNGKIKVLAKFYCIAVSINIFLTTFLHIAGIFEFHYTVTTTHVLLILFLPVVVMLIISYSHKTRKQAFIGSLIPLGLFVCFLLNAVIQYHKGTYSNYSRDIRIALISFLLCLLIYQTNEVAVTFSKGLKADMLHDLALTDHLTGLYNRTALNEHTNDYEHAIASFSPLGIIQFDVNNLKRVNDSLGHEVGDKMITAASAGLKQSFNNNCKIYRTGGDEFLIIINDTEPELIYKSGIEKLKEYCINYNSQPNLEFKLVIAHGYVTVKGNTTLSEAIDMADVLMYRDKRELKAKEADSLEKNRKSEAI